MKEDIHEILLNSKHPDIKRAVKLIREIEEALAEKLTSEDAPGTTKTT